MPAVSESNHPTAPPIIKTNITPKPTTTAAVRSCVRVADANGILSHKTPYPNTRTHLKSKNSSNLGNGVRSTRLDRMTLVVDPRLSHLGRLKSWLVKITARVNYKLFESDCGAPHPPLTPVRTMWPILQTGTDLRGRSLWLKARPGRRTKSTPNRKPIPMAFFWH